MQIDPEKHNMRIVEDILTELETMQFILASSNNTNTIGSNAG